MVNLSGIFKHEDDRSDYREEIHKKRFEFTRVSFAFDVAGLYSPKSERRPGPGCREPLEKLRCQECIGGYLWYR
jgi:hypothetical protein